jgi:hypothetical protein
LPLSEIVRHDIIDEDTKKRRGDNIIAFKSKLMFLQSDKALTLINFEEKMSKEVLSNKYGYSALNVDYDQENIKF